MGGEAVLVLLSIVHLLGTFQAVASEVTPAPAPSPCSPAPRPHLASSLLSQMFFY